MPRVRGDRGSQLERVGIDRAAVDKPWLAEREGAGFVEDDVSISARRSSAPPSLTMMPCSNKRRAATTWTMGTARPSAHGHVMIRTATAIISARWTLRSQPPADKCRHGSHVNHRSVKPRRRDRKCGGTPSA